LTIEHGINSSSIKMRNIDKCLTGILSLFLRGKRGRRRIPRPDIGGREKGRKKWKEESEGERETEIE
jgi:hypothetical protein